MAGLYLYVPVKKVEDITACGLKLSEWYDREIILPGLDEPVKVIKTLLNPKDDESKLKDSYWQCLRLEVNPDYCRVGDAVLYKMGLKNEKIMEYYKATMTPLKEYNFGRFRHPEALLTCSVLPDKIEVMGKVLDIPVLYENSAVLYLSNNLENERSKDSGNRILFSYYQYLENRGEAVSYEDKEHGYKVFFYNGNKDYIVLQIP
jgi:hypothetical protein